MPKSGTLDDNLIPAKEKEKPKRGRQEDGTWITSKGEVLPAKDRTRREPYPEPQEAQVDGHEEVVQSPEGTVAFLARRMSEQEFQRAGFPNRKRLDLRYACIEVYAGLPRKHYSFDELEQLRRGEMKR